MLLHNNLSWAEQSGTEKANCWWWKASFLYIRIVSLHNYFNSAFFFVLFVLLPPARICPFSNATTRSRSHLLRWSSFFTIHYHVCIRLKTTLFRRYLQIQLHTSLTFFKISNNYMSTSPNFCGVAAKSVVAKNGKSSRSSRKVNEISLRCWMFFFLFKCYSNF